MHAVGRFVGVVSMILSAAIPAASAQRIHTVVDGQTLGGIAKRYGITVTDLQKANQLPNGTVLKQGQRLLVPSPGEMDRPRNSPTRTSSEEAMLAQSEGTTQVNAPASAAPESEPSTEASGGGGSDAATATETTGTEQQEATTQPETADSPTDGNAANAPRRTEAHPAKSSIARKSKRTVSTAEHRYHTVSDGHTLGKIAKRYHISIESLCGANGITRRTGLKIGQKLVIPNGDDDPIITLGPEPSESRERDSGDRSDHGDPNALKQLTVPGASTAYYYEPTGAGRRSMRPIVVYLHGRGGDAEADCRRWSRIARRFGWLLCPSGPTPYNAGRTWNNNWVSGQNAVMGAVQALRERYGRRVQLYGNTLVGFSEGAYVAMNVGVRQPRTFNRWLILGADVSYWGGSGLEALKDAKSKVRRVVLITGGRDMVVDDTRTVAGWLENEGVPLRVQTPGDLAHEVAIERKPQMYVSALHWLDNG